MKKVLLVVLVLLVCALGAVAYVGYRFLDLVSGCGSGCIVSYHGGPVIQGSGNVVTQTRSVSGFTTIALESSAKVEIRRTGSESLSVTGDDNLLPLFTSDVRGGTLYLGVAANTSFKGKTPVFRITVADLIEIRISGSGDIDARDLDGATLSVSVAGSGNVHLAGRADQLTVSIAGSGDVDASGLKAKRARVAISGSGDATVDASDALDARITGSGDLRYLGSPTITRQIAGSGSIKPR